MDMLFAADTPWVWDAEKTFARLQEQNPEMMQGGRRRSMDVEEKAAMRTDHVELTLN